MARPIPKIKRPGEVKVKLHTLIGQPPSEADLEKFAELAKKVRRSKLEGLGQKKGQKPKILAITKENFRKMKH